MSTRINTTTQQPETTVDLAVQVAPQHNAVSWALYQSRSRGIDKQAALVLVAYAQHAQASLFSGDGYNGTTAGDVGAMLSLPLDTVEYIGGYLYCCGLLVAAPRESAPFTSFYRVPESALDGSWAR